MVAERLGRLAARVVTALEPAAARAKATDFAQRLKAEYERGLAEAGDEPVADTGRNGHSVFAWNLVQRLRGLGVAARGHDGDEGAPVLERDPRVLRHPRSISME